MITIKAKIAGVIFSSPSSGFHVLKSESPDLNSDEKITGTFPGMTFTKGATYSFTGERGIHKTYGRQFVATTASLIPDRTKLGLITYLSNSVTSIGPITASKIYDRFGDGLLDMLNSHDFSFLDGCDFLSDKQKESIKEEWKANDVKRGGSILLADLGFNARQIKSILTVFGADISEIIKTNPYKLCGAPSVSFSSVDSLALNRGGSPDSILRLKAIVLWSIKEICSSEGHMYVTSNQLKHHISKRFFKKHSVVPFTHGDEVSDSVYYQALVDLTNESQIHIDGESIYSIKSWEAEHNISLNVKQFLLSSPKEWGDTNKTLDEFEKNTGFTLAPEQRDAYNLITKSNLFVITGYPGTGKTTLISSFVYLCDVKNLSYTLMSPTGIAAKRLSQVTGKPASTIHRALGYKIDGTWEFNAGNKFYSDVVIVDEMSMVDSDVFEHLISSLHPNTTLIMLGDVAQLPSVGAGYVLNELVNSNFVPSINLTKIYRQGRTSDIITVAHDILNGSDLNLTFNKDSEFVCLHMPKENVASEVCKLASRLKASDKKFQVISPMYDGDLGVNSLNVRLREVLNTGFDKSSPHIRSGASEIYEGDRVMFIKNDYDMMVFNGDVGKVSRIDIKADEIDIKVFDWFDPASSSTGVTDKTVTYTIEEAKQNLKTAYACTAHKVQGQEFDYVLMPMSMEFNVMLYRNLVYTAITRAKKKVFLFGDLGAFSVAVSNIKDSTRNSNLAKLVDSSLLQM